MLFLLPWAALVYNSLVRLTSPSFPDNGVIPMKYTCDDLGISPPLRWDEVPPETKGFALTVIDPDAPLHWLHWLVCNIRGEARLIPEGGPVPPGALEVRNDFGKRSYGGPCPPQGEHRYFFTLYALDTDYLRLRKGNFISICQLHAVEKAELLGRYNRGGPVGSI